MKKAIIIFSIVLYTISISCDSKKEEKPKQSEKQLEKIKKKLAEKEMHSLKNATVHNPFLKLDIDEVIAYEYITDMDTEIPYIVDNKGNLNKTVTQKKILTTTQIDTLKTFLGSIHTYGKTKADCFEPHLGIVFYKDHKVVEHVSICISCNHLASSVKIPAMYYKGNKTVGFSPKAKHFLSDFCQSLGFKYCKN